jgi:hypothetical protein
MAAAPALQWRSRRSRKLMQMNVPKKDFAPHRDWRLVLVAVLAAAILAAGIVYKYTGDFTGFATFGTSGQSNPK